MRTLVVLAVAALGCSNPAVSPPVSVSDNRPRCGASLSEARPFPFNSNNAAPSVQCSDSPFWADCAGVAGQRNGVIVAERNNGSGDRIPAQILNCGECGLACPVGQHCGNVAYEIRGQVFAGWECQSGFPSTGDAAVPAPDVVRPAACSLSENIDSATLLPDGGCSYRCTSNAQAGYATCDSRRVCQGQINSSSQCGRCGSSCGSDPCVYGARADAPELGMVWHCGRRDAGI